MIKSDIHCPNSVFIYLEKMTCIELVFRFDNNNDYVHIQLKTLSNGAKCSKNGRDYELEVARTCTMVASPLVPEVPLNTQSPSDLGGCTANQDLYLNWQAHADVGVEVKRVTPDWMQMSIIRKDDQWVPSSKAKIPQAAQELFMEYINNIGFPVPPFLTETITYEYWSQVKSEFKDRYLRIPDDTISKAYAAKGSKYIQLRGYGLYRTGEDVCGFDVPFFECEQYVRVRCKRHGKKDATGKHIPSSVMMSFTPKLKTLPKSPYSLDCLQRMPHILRKII